MPFVAQANGRTLFAFVFGLISILSITRCGNAPLQASLNASSNNSSPVTTTTSQQSANPLSANLSVVSAFTGFQSVPIGTSQANCILIQNTGGSVATQFAASISGPFSFPTASTACAANQIALCSPNTPIAQNATCGVEVVFAPTAQGAQSTTLTVNYSSGSELLSLPVPITGSAQGADFTFATSMSSLPSYWAFVSSVVSFAAGYVQVTHAPNTATGGLSSVFSVIAILT